MEESLLGIFENAPHLISFLAGILTFISPCVLPLIPAYFSYISEISLDELKNTGVLDLKKRFRILRGALFFVFGLGLVFVLLGVVAARILNGGILLSPVLRYFAGGVLVVFGLHTLGVIRIPFLNYQKTLRTSGNFGVLRDFLTPFLLGVSFSLGWTPCVGPILASIIALASLDEQSGITLLVIYTLGLTLPFLLCALLIGYAFSFLEGIKRYFKIIEWCAGVLLISIGILVASGGMSVVSAYLVKVL
ncbi:cytochrome c biogenesis CcdA family protein [Helicobacter turcicus]|uniref:Cytochrome c biogenesis protein CcdA n=1 Tax=Helicobacter turcicus TaxID=2867412 RepID=A0ABS7JPP0_9HELI|nr:cytochrome c biogenesis protein CcdA [Helicobacter turcicus]MBX7491380.1 cytochrome c biogenesis protein CcdA [Helicobacter turcicus]MBX7546247.1 cytochrome c biogenesis protein CcdA [Helicobacter turcicus]